MPGLKFGLVLGTGRFRDLVGGATALSILGSARAFDAQEALDIGFVQSTAAESSWPDLLARPRKPLACCVRKPVRLRSEEHTSELQSLMRNSYAVFCLKKK